MRARYVLPLPDGPIIRMFDLRMETSPPNFRYSMRLRWLYAAMARTSFACRCPMTYWSSCSKIRRGVTWRKR